MKLINTKGDGIYRSGTRHRRRVSHDKSVVTVPEFRLKNFSMLFYRSFVLLYCEVFLGIVAVNGGTVDPQWRPITDLPDYPYVGSTHLRTDLTNLIQTRCKNSWKKSRFQSRLDYEKYRDLCEYLVVLCESCNKKTWTESVQVNISDTWFLPKQGLSLFYRYFSNKVTWDEANTICHSHGGSLILPDNDEKMDSLQAYLKEIQTLGHVWLGLKKEVLDHSFLWMNGKPIKGDGLWLEPIPKANTRLCAMIDPSADFRWISFHCGGPETASFVCELKAPQWAQNGCMVPELSSLLITFEPDIGVVQLISDCGLEGTRRITCKGRINREDVVKHLSCKENPYTDRSITDRMNYGTSLHSSTTNKESLTQATNALTWIPLRLTRHKRSVKPTYPVNTSHEG